MWTPRLGRHIRRRGRFNCPQRQVQRRLLMLRQLDSQNQLFLLVRRQQQHQRRPHEQQLDDLQLYLLPQLLQSSRYHLQRNYLHQRSTRMLIIIHRMETPLIQLHVHNVNDVDVKSAKNLDNYHLGGFVTIHVCVVLKQLLTMHLVCAVLKHCITIVLRIMKWIVMAIVYHVLMIHVRVCHIKERHVGVVLAHYQWHYLVYGATGQCKDVSHYVPIVMLDIQDMVVDVRRVKLKQDVQLVEPAILHLKKDCWIQVQNFNNLINYFINNKNVTKDCKRSLLMFRYFILFNNNDNDYVKSGHLKMLFLLFIVRTLINYNYLNKKL